MRAKGFTLLELVAALAIFALLSVMAYGGLNALLTTHRALEQSLDSLEDWQMTVHRLRLDLEQIRNRPIRDAFGDVQAAVSMQQDGRLEFTHGGRRNPMGLPRSSLERVAYYLEDRALIRESWPQLDRPQGLEGQRLAVVDGIEDLKWRFLDESDEWQDSWPPLNLGAAPDALAPPRAIELQLRTRRYGAINLLFATRSEL